MEQMMFSEDTVSSNRIIYTPSEFAKSSLLYLQETGELKAQRPHTKSRSGLDSYLFFIVLFGSGELKYNDITYTLKPNDCIFIDCKQPYAHITSDDLWKLKWVHFDGQSMSAVYNKYVSRGGEPAFAVEQPEKYIGLLDDLFAIASSDDYIRDMKINEKLSSLLTLIMSKSWNPGKTQSAPKRRELSAIKSWLDNNYSAKVSLDDLAAQFYIDKYYLSKIFKEKYGITINTYVSQKRITTAKQLLRFSDKTIEQVGCEIGITDTNYFTRLFRKIEGITPGEYRKLW
ncbi:MAG: AraC family transcriptional regulator [Ruminococcus sp.]|nr:AraC family transcriptional regulator [Ruminococcus sp.]